jgi:hypothetical protein
MIPLEVIFPDKYFVYLNIFFQIVDLVLNKKLQVY